MSGNPPPGDPPALVSKWQRMAHLTAVRRVDAGDPGALGELMARAIVDGQWRSSRQWVDA